MLEGKKTLHSSILEQTIETKTFIKRLLSCSIKVNASKVVIFCQKQKPTEISGFKTNQLHALSMWFKDEVKVV